MENQNPTEAKIVKTPEDSILEKYGEMSQEELRIHFFNEEKIRCANAPDEELARRLKGIRIMQIALKAREHAVDATDRERNDKRTQAEREARRELDKKYSPEPREKAEKKIETLADRIEREKKEKENQFEKEVSALASAMDCSKDEARQILKSRKKGIR